MSECTWLDCTKEGLWSQKDSDGNEWSLLCLDHHLMLDRQIEDGRVKYIMRAWVLASGGAKKLAKTMDDFKGR